MRVEWQAVRILQEAVWSESSLFAQSYLPQCLDSIYDIKMFMK